MDLCCCEYQEFQLGGRRVILDIERSRLYQLDEIALHILATLRGKAMRKEALVQLMALYYSIDAVQETVAELELLQLISTEVPYSSVPKPPPLPDVRALCLLIIQECNMRCRYCYGQGGTYGAPGLSMSSTTAIQAVEFLLTQIPPDQSGSLRFFGGEPLLCWDLLQEVILYARRREQEEHKNIHFSLTTNGTLLTNRRISFLKEQHVHVDISLDGPAELHDRMRVFSDGTGSYHRVRNAIEEVRAGKVQLHLRATVDPANPQLARVVDHLLAFDPVLVCFEPASKGIGDEAVGQPPLNLQKHKYEYQALKERYIRVIQTESKVMPIFNFIRFLRMLTGDGLKSFYGCGMGRSYLAVAANGDFYACHRLVGQPEYRLGNLNRGISAGARERFQALATPQRESCRECWARYLCGGGCYYEAAVTQGNLEHPDPLHCELSREMIMASIEIAMHLSQANLVEIQDKMEHCNKVFGYH